MIVQAISDIADLAPYRHRWNALAGECPFRSWAWLSNWWKHYNAHHRLQVLLVAPEAVPCSSDCTRDRGLPHPDQLLAILPAYVEKSRQRGRVLRLLGDGEVCSEHLDLLCENQHAAEASGALAEHLTADPAGWDVIQFSTVVENNRNLGELVQKLTTRGCLVDRRAGANLWSIPLPGSWEEFLAMQSKSHRKQLRQLTSRVLETKRAQWIEVRDHSQFDSAWEVLIDLHQRRRQSLGEPGCFSSPRWANFHREVALELLAANQLRLSYLQLDHRPVAVEYHLADSNATYAYQGGIEPAQLDAEPGQLSLILCIERAIAAGQQRLELLRGDEPYKPHWRAEATPTSDLEIVAPRASARWRHYSWSSLRRASRMVRQFANLLS
jgi:CelD/BcsL family acetyltransferase involved in cellulose biosynthesis